MSIRHPIIAVTGSSGAGTTTVMNAFKHIFRREQIKARLREAMSEQTEDWGVTVRSVEIQDIKPSENMQSAMERQAAAERERERARRVELPSFGFGLTAVVEESAVAHRDAAADVGERAGAERDVHDDQLRDRGVDGWSDRRPVARWRRAVGVARGCAHDERCRQEHPGG